MKNLLKLAALASLALLFAGRAEARPRQKSDGSVDYPRASNSGLSPANLNQYGIAVTTESVSGTVPLSFDYSKAKQWSTSPGQLYGVSMDSAAAVGDYVICIDSAPTYSGPNQTGIQTSTPTANLTNGWATADRSLQAVTLTVCSRSATLTQFCVLGNVSGTPSVGVAFKSGLLCQGDTDGWYAPAFREDR